ncbi:hypothetical protein JN11_00094 [Mucilaginibacter frigoritolerans]|uniref:SPOR domain-containing protein n=1 Tax=Mucilaginibacter frigoritolerans TaxID=652788 RepID=A0A562UF14_9SPHI|nr:hypothetical protein [Mucilaginibacter frigoritolerans]TWJ04386.1 hypothetical protein JN11_00094 [Mucilaginibacter frigoritolerans]
MNLADYLSELLGQHDEVSVPGLGYFVRERVSGFYNDREAKFYPPHHKIRFVSQQKEDDTFVQYVADKKNISLASSKYFAEKFILKLKEEASKGKYLFADLGIFQTDNDHNLVFKAHEKVAADPSFYGYPAIDINRLNKPSGGDIKSVYAEPVVTTPVTISEHPIQTVENQQYFEEDSEERKTTNVWLIILISLAVIALALFGVYKFYPSVFDKINATYHKIINKKEDSIVPVYRHEIKADSIKKPIPKKDTTTLTATAIPLDTVKPTIQWAVIAYKNRLKKLATDERKRFQDKGVNAEIVPRGEIPGPLYRVSVGTFPTENEAEAKKDYLIKAKMISPNSEIIQINAQQ